MFLQRVFQLLWRPFCVFVVFLGVIAVATAAEPTVAGRTRDQWREQLRGGDDLSRIQAANALSQFAILPVQDLAAALADENATVRYWAMRGLKRRAGMGPYDEDKLGVHDKSAAVRIETAAGVARRNGTMLALGILRDELRSPVDGVRIQAIGALEEMGEDAKPLREVFITAQKDSNEYVKRIATRIIERWKD